MKLEDAMKAVSQAHAELEDELDPEGPWEDMPDEVKMGAPKHLFIYAVRKKAKSERERFFGLEPRERGTLGHD